VFPFWGDPRDAFAGIPDLAFWNACNDSYDMALGRFLFPR
jgi:hypothetical protein